MLIKFYIMSIDFLPSLQMMSCVQIAIPILDCPKIRRLINSYSQCSQWPKSIEVCNLVEKVVKEKVQLRIGPLLQGRLTNAIMSMFSQIVECKKTFSSMLTDCDIYVDQNYKFVWKFDGTIDQRMSAKALIVNESLHIKERFHLACNYCFVEKAYCLWNTMQATEIYFTPLQLECNFIINFWTETFQKGYIDMRITYQVLELSTLQRNIFLLQYVLKMVPHELQPLLLLNIVLKDNVDADVTRFCLSRLPMNYKEMVFNKSPVKVLQCFVTWPYQSVFLQVAGCLWTYLSKERFYEILWFILHILMDQDWSDFNLVELLKEFWSESPIDFKEYIKHQTVFRQLMIVLNCDMQYFPRNSLYFTT